MEKMYFDTCIVSGLAKNEFAVSRNEKIFEILKKYESKELDLVASELMEQEIAKIPAQYRTPHQSLYLLLGKIPRVGEILPNRMLLLGVGGGSRVNPVYKALREILPDETDAKHILTAMGNGCTHFVTVDERTIIRNREKIKPISEIKIVLPEELF